jgi:fimbrial chaperone protein
MVQIRVFKWNQDGLKDNYNGYDCSLPSGKLALLVKRSICFSPALILATGGLGTYRLIVDELPIRLSDGNEQDASKVSFQMRYSIPLFAYGKGIGIWQIGAFG